MLDAVNIGQGRCNQNTRHKPKDLRMRYECPYQGKALWLFHKRSEGGLINLVNSNGAMQCQITIYSGLFQQKPEVNIK